MLSENAIRNMTPTQRDRLEPDQVPATVRDNPDLRHRLFRSPSGIYDFKAAAKYLGLSWGGLAYHVYHAPKKNGGHVALPSIRVGRTHAYTQHTLDRFEQTRREPGFLPGHEYFPSSE